jgi:thiol-disulfide isomerase/thioredoxin
VGAPLALLSAAALSAVVAVAEPPLSSARGSACAGPALPDGTRRLSQLPLGPFPGLDGHEHHLTDWSGKVLLVNFWAGWCGPCQYEIPDLVAFQSAHAADGLQIVGIGLDRQDRLANVARSLEVNYPVMVAGEGPGAALMARWGNSSQTVPYTVVFDPGGCVARVRRGVLDRTALEDYVLPLLESSGHGP